VAFLRMRCGGGRDCRGRVRLVARIRVRHASASRRLRKRVRNLTAGRARFSIAGGGSKMVHIRLTAKGKRLVRRARRRGLRARLRGIHVKSRMVTLRKAPKRHTRRVRHRTRHALRG
jgi:hypothetical protein